ncbi:ferredoxin reductase [Actinoplanes sp. NEAU-A12]|uniref:Ferredoxin reductase n=1 Tax=Actinoplanes sandaracinus TaxID=3045177 RepID=A0ABT6WPJ9_9ACTN|nr:ferredoxin reductase [Actinoplanes sandaracinus]MDI6101629.1 ferredoxin reductase [Actinoplanes sandaracinus]
MKNRKVIWRAATVTEARWETPTARTLVLDIPDWPGHLAGQHVDIRLTAEDGYQAQRSYSIASAWSPAAARTASDDETASDRGTVEISVQRLEDGEVSPYLTDVVEAGDQIEVRGPIGGWFVWRPEATAPVVLVAGGSGMVPLMAMIRARGLAGGRQPFRLIYSVRTPADALYADELRRRAVSDPGLDVRFVYTRETPEGWPVPPKRIDVATINSYGWPADFAPDCFVCGPNTFVETAADILVALGHDPKLIRTERFGGA